MSKTCTSIFWQAAAINHEVASSLVGHHLFGFDGAFRVSVLPVDEQDRDTRPALDAGKEHRPSLRLAIRDGASTAERWQTCCDIHGGRHRLFREDPDHKGFVVLERRWVVERTFGGLGHWAACTVNAPVASMSPRDAPLASPALGPPALFAIRHEIMRSSRLLIEARYDRHHGRRTIARQRLTDFGNPCHDG